MNILKCTLLGFVAIVEVVCGIGINLITAEAPLFTESTT